MLGRISGGHGRAAGALALVAICALAGCTDRERLIVEPPGDGIGPVTVIDRPGVADTTVQAGPGFTLTGRTTDPDGVDTVYFLLAGTNETFSPFAARGDQEVRFSLPLGTNGRSGARVQIEIYGVDLHGNRGASSVRSISIQ